MSDVMIVPRRPRGRPQVRSDEQTRHVVAEAARGVFVASGFFAANMDEVARAASVSKKTLYRLFPTKAELFRASIADRIDGFILALDEHGLARLPPEAALERVLAEYGRLTLSPDTSAIQRLVYSESGRFPELAADFYRGAVVATRAVFVRVLERLRGDGLIQLDDVEDAVGMLRGMMTFEPARAAALAQTPLPQPAEIEQRAARCARLFLDGCRSSPHAEPEAPMCATRARRSAAAFKGGDDA